MAAKNKLRDEIDKIPEAKTQAPKNKDKIQKAVDTLKEEYGLDVEPRKNTRFKIDRATEYLNNNYSFRYNLFVEKPEFKIKNSDGEFRFVDPRGFANIRTKMKKELNCNYAKDDVEELILTDELSGDYNPIKEYIFSLPNWDGVDRFNDFLKQIQLENQEQDQLRLVKHFKMWFVAMVASLVEDHVINEMALIFTGKQGRGKTRFFTSLIPKELRLRYYYSGGFNPHDKDQREMLGTKILINLDEMATLTRTDIESIKSAMSERYIILRRAFGRQELQLFRRASFCGSNNDEKFLTDQTGNRRWLPFAIHDIDVKEDFDIGLLYAQALKMYKDKDIKLWLDKQEIDESEEYNEGFRFVPMEEELILATYRKPDKEELAMGLGVEYLTTSEILHFIASKDDYKKMNVNDTSLKRMGKALRSLGFEKRPKYFPDLETPRNVWCIKKLESGELAKINDQHKDESII